MNKKEYSKSDEHQEKINDNLNPDADPVEIKKSGTDTKLDEEERRGEADFVEDGYDDEYDEDVYEDDDYDEDGYEDDDYEDDDYDDDDYDDDDYEDDDYDGDGYEDDDGYEDEYDPDIEAAYYQDPDEDEEEESDTVPETAAVSGNHGSQRGGGMNRRGRNRRRRKRKGGFGKKPWIIAGCAAGAILVIYLGISAYFINHFYINTVVNGKVFSGKTVEDVETYLKEEVQGYELTIIEEDNATDVIKGTDISLAYEENEDVENALKEQNPLLWIKALFSKSTAEVTIDVSFDEEALNEKIQSVQAVVAEQTEPVSAYPKFDGTSFVVEPEVYGTAVDMDVLHSRITEYITEFRSELNMMEEGCYKTPKYTSESEEVQAACDTMNKYCEASVTYQMTEDVVVDKTLISGWLSYDDNMQVTLNEDAIREWMREFGSKYDTVGSTRSITTPGGKTVEVSGGTYGWSVDEDTETENLINSIKNGEVVSREPAYAQTAASHSEQDWGTTYLEVDRTAQHMWYIVDGSIALETDVVTGRPTPDRETPLGVYYILYTERDATLVGETDPSTGEPIYETDVSYWMPFTWQGHGFHDAIWQSAFGGTVYQTNAGSHGCVNMPLDMAGKLIDMVSEGTPVIIHD